MKFYEQWSRLRQNPLIRRWHLMLGAIASFGLGWAAIRELDWFSVKGKFLEIEFWVFLLAISLLVSSMIARSLRWHVLLRGQLVHPWHTFLTQNTGIGLNNLLPIRMISEPVQLVIIIRHYKVPGPIAFATLVAGNVMDIFATGILMAVSVVISPQLRGANIQLAGAFILFLVSLLVFIIVGRGLQSIPIAKRIRFFQELAIAIGLLKQSVGRLIASFFCTSTSWVLVGFAGWFIARNLGIELNVLGITALLVASTFFVSAVPSLPGGVGVYEAAMTHTLQLLGADPAAAFTFAIIMHALIFVPPTGIALFMLIRLGTSQILKRPIRHQSAGIDGKEKLIKASSDSSHTQDR